MPKSKTRKVLDLIDDCHAILARIQPATVRALAYQLFIAGKIPDMASKQTKRLSHYMARAREDGAIPWEWIVDDSRQPERAAVWDNPSTFIPVVLNAYRRDRWLTQPCRVEVWSEKGTVSGTLRPVLQQYAVNFRVLHGFSSATALHDVAQEYGQSPVPVRVVYIGDHDPGGAYMPEVDIPQRLQRYGGGAIVLQRLAALPSDLATVPTFDVNEKQKDTRFPWFTRLYGRQSRCCEVDALNPNDLRARVEAAIRQDIDQEAWERCDVIERAEQRSLEEVLGRWQDAKNGPVRK